METLEDIKKRLAELEMTIQKRIFLSHTSGNKHDNNPEDSNRNPGNNAPMDTTDEPPEIIRRNCLRN